MPTIYVIQAGAARAREPRMARPARTGLTATPWRLPSHPYPYNY